MRFYNQQHRFYCGVDLHARTISLHVLDAAGETCLAKTLAANPAAFLKAIAPFRDGLVVACECMFAWYSLAAPTSRPPGARQSSAIPETPARSRPRRG
jgi:hypothetical protein